MRRRDNPRNRIGPIMTAPPLRHCDQPMRRYSSVRRVPRIGYARDPLFYPTKTLPGGERAAQGGVRGTHQRLDRRGYDVLIEPDAKDLAPVGGPAFHIGRRSRRRAALQSLLLIVDHGERDAAMIPERGNEGRHRSVPVARDGSLAPVDEDGGAGLALRLGAVMPLLPMIDKRDPLAVLERVGVAEELPDLRRAQLLAGAVGDLLDDPAETDLQAS